MYSFLPRVQNWYTNNLFVLARLLHEKLGFSPNQVSFISFVFSLVAAVFVFYSNLPWAFVFLFISLLLDATDGTIARRYNLETKLGKYLETIFDRTAELLLLLALYSIGLVSFYLITITFLAILLMTVLAQKTQIDFGGKRTVLFLGPIIGFPPALYIIFSIQAISIAVSLYKITNKNVKRA